jgi:hypothetical protein
MQRSIYLAKLIGPIMLVVGLGMLLNGAAYRVIVEQFLHSYALIYLAGIAGMLIGLALVHAHNEWQSDWRVIITLLGWLSLISGIFRTLVPQEVAAIGNSLFANAATMMIAGFVVLVLGGVLSYFGYAEIVEKASRATKPRARKRSRR